jgi:type I restriction enzyme S subunit
MSEGEVVPDGWEVKPIKELGDIVTGTTPSTKEERFWGSLVPFISPADFKGSLYINKTARYLSREGARRGRILPGKSILVTCIGSLGGMAMTSIESTTNQQINAVVPNNKHDPHFCFYQLLQNINELKKNAGKYPTKIILTF